MITSRCRSAAASLTVLTVALAGLTAVAAPADAATAPVTVSQVASPGEALGVNNAGDVLTLNPESFEVDSYLVTHTGFLVRLSADSNLVDADALNGYGVSTGTYYVDNLFQTGATWNRQGKATAVRGYPGANYDDDGQIATPIDINDSGALVGYAYLPSAKSPVATRWSAAGVPSRIDPAGGSGVSVTAINNKGVVSGAVAGHAALFGPSTSVTTLGRLSGETSSVADGVTDTGAAFGTSIVKGTTVSVVWDSTGHATRVSLPAGTTSFVVHAENIHGVLVGTASKSNGDSVAVGWTTPTKPLILPKLAASTGAANRYQAYSINDSGAIAGTTVIDPGTSGYATPLLWTPIKS